MTGSHHTDQHVWGVQAKDTSADRLTCLPGRKLHLQLPGHHHVCLRQAQLRSRSGSLKRIFFLGFKRFLPARTAAWFFDPGKRERGQVHKAREKDSFFTVSGSTLLRENVFIWVLVYPDFLVALEPGEKNWGRRKKSEAGEKSIKQEKKDFFSCLLGILASD